MQLAEKIYAELTAAGVEVILDDRDERPGVKFKDADLVGFPSVSASARSRWRTEKWNSSRAAGRAVGESRGSPRPGPRVSCRQVVADGGRHHSITAAPHVRPAPKTTSSTRSPR